MQTIDNILRQAESRCWEVAVIGAGPAGSVTAYELARRGLKTLLIDQAEFPRDKVCGGCLNAQALADLAESRLSSDVLGLKGPTIDSLELWSDQHTVSLRIPQGLAVSRSDFDQSLVDAALTAGAQFLAGVRVDLNQMVSTPDHREFRCSTKKAEARIGSRIVVLATGLPAATPHDSPFQVRVASGSRIGLGCVAKEFPEGYQHGRIYMAVGREGYVGLTRLEGGRLNMAAAIDAGALREVSSPRGLCRRIVREAGLPVCNSMFSDPWQGTLGLTRQRIPVALHRLFAVGDSAGYVEPFTGAGMAWAIRSARSVVPLIEQGLRNWDPHLARQWSRTLHQLLGGEQQKCRHLTRWLRRPYFVRTAIHAINRFPWLGQMAVRYF